MSVGAGLLHPRAHSDEIGSILGRHARACRGHLRLSYGPSVIKTWMAGTSPAMTPSNWINMTGTRSSMSYLKCSGTEKMDWVYLFGLGLVLWGACGGVVAVGRRIWSLDTTLRIH